MGESYSILVEALTPIGRVGVHARRGFPSVVSGSRIRQDCNCEHLVCRSVYLEAVITGAGCNRRHLETAGYPKVCPTV